MPQVWLPPRLQRLANGQQKLQVPGQNVRQIVEHLGREFPGMLDELYFEEEDVLMPGVSVIIDGETSQLGLLERVQEDSEVHFLPALGGGT
jgi:molybdopterin synthase sulfur carrier subunit